MQATIFDMENVIYTSQRVELHKNMQTRKCERFFVHPAHLMQKYVEIGICVCVDCFFFK